MPCYAALASAEGPEGLFATLEALRLIIRSAETKTLIRNIDLDPKIVPKCRILRWYKPKSLEDSSQRLLIATTENVYVYDIRNPRWQATIKKACGEGCKIANVDFGAHEDEIIVTSFYGMKVSIWSLMTGSATEVRDPKNPPSRAHSIRPWTQQLAILTRPGAKDVVTVLDPPRKAVEYTIMLPTIDAQGIRWSPDGKWLALWDAASAGSSVLVYTATGQLFKRFTAGSRGEDLGCGIQTIDWDPESRHLIVAANNSKVILLSTRSFQPIAVLEYCLTISLNHAAIHEEQITDQGTRVYKAAQQPVAPPANVSALGFNHFLASPTNALLACVSARTPSTVWIHSLHPTFQVKAVIIHHRTVKHLSWHPHFPGLLLIHCLSTKATVDSKGPSTSSSNEAVYVWSYDCPTPLVISVTSATATPIETVAWLDTISKPRARVGTATTCAVISVLDPEEDEDEAEFPTPKTAPQQKSLFAVQVSPAPMLGYDAETPITGITGSVDFSPIKMDTAQLTKTLGFQFTSLNDVNTDDTFEFKKR